MRLHLIYLVKNEKDHSIPEWNEPIGAAFKSIRINQIGLSHIKFLWGIDSIYQLMIRNIRALGRWTSSLKITIKKLYLLDKITQLITTIITYLVYHIQVWPTYQLSVIRTLTEGVFAASCEYHYSRYKYAHLEIINLIIIISVTESLKSFWQCLENIEKSSKNYLRY